MSNYFGKVIGLLNCGMLCKTLLFSVFEPSTVMWRKATPPDVLESRIEAYLSPYVRSMNFTGAILVAKSGRILLRRGFGIADSESGVRNTPQTSFYIGQLSESFTAIAILLLEQQGKLSVNDVLARYIPDFPNSNAITIHDLLSHASGTPNVMDFPNFAQRSGSRHGLEEIIIKLKQAPRILKRSAPYSYSSSDYILLAYIIEKASGQSYGDFLRDNIFGPLSMNHTAHDIGTPAPNPHPASRYLAAGPREVEKAPYLDWSLLIGTASVYTSVDDLYKLDRALYGEGLLKEGSKQKMDAYVWGRPRGVGRQSSAFAINHRAPGLEANIERYPNDDICVIVLSNVFSSLTHTISDDLAGIALGERRTPLAPPNPAPVPSAALKRYVGRYQFSEHFLNSGRVIEVRKRGDALALVADGLASASYLIPKGNNEFLDRLYGGTVTFRTNKGGRVVGLLWKLSKNHEARKL